MPEVHISENLQRITDDVVMAWITESITEYKDLQVSNIHFGQKFYSLGADQIVGEMKFFKLFRKRLIVFLKDLTFLENICMMV